MSHLHTKTITVSVLAAAFLLLAATSLLLGPRLTVLPKDFADSMDVVSRDRFYDEATSSFREPVFSKTRFRYETVSEIDGTSLLNVDFDVRTPEGDPIFSVTRLYAVNRSTGKHAPDAGDRPREGSLFAPRHLRPGQSFVYWHVNYDAPALMRYVDTETVHGLRVLRYESRYEGEVVDQTDNLRHLEGVGITRGVQLRPHLWLWVEPVTGMIVKYQDDTVASFYDLATGEELHPWNHFTNVTDESDVMGRAAAMKALRIRFLLFDRILPLILFLLAAGLIVQACFAIGVTPVRRIFSRQFTLSLSALVMFGLLLSVATGMASLMSRNFDQAAHADFDAAADRAISSFGERINVYSNALHGGVGLFAASDHVSRSEWASYVDAIDLEENYPGIQALGYSVFIHPEDRADHVAVIRSEGFRDYDIRPEGERPLYSSIVYIEPFDERNRKAFGFDMFQEPVRRSAMEQARDTGEPRMSGKITLVQEIDEDVQPGFLLYMPEYVSQKASPTLDDRRASIRGYVYAAFRARNFVEGTIGSAGLRDISLSVYDGVEALTGSLLYDDASRVLGTENAPRFTEERVVYLAGRPWLFRFRSTSVYGRSLLAAWVPRLTFFVGVWISFLLALYFHELMSSRTKAIRYADALTEDLQHEKRKDEAILSALDQAALVSITDVKGNIIFANDRFVQVSKYAREELHGHNHRILKSGDQPEELFVDLWRTVSRGGIWRGEIKNRAKDGSHYWVDTTIAPIMDESGHIKQYLSVRFLITDRKQAERKLAEGKAFDETMFRSIGDGLVATDAHGNVIIMNPACENLLGWTEAELKGISFAKKVPIFTAKGKSIAIADRPMFQALAKGRSMQTGTMLYLKKNGEMLPVKITVSPILREGKIIGSIEVFRDVTKELALEKRQKEFITLSSHQLRTPLTEIRWSLSALRKGALDTGQKSMFDTALHAAESMSDTIRAMLAIAHIEAGETKPRSSEVHLRDFIQDVASMQDGARTHKNISLNLSGVAPITLKTDPDMLKEILVSLLSNAIKYTPEGGNVSISTSERDSNVLIHIQDSGYGIPESEQARLFQRFFRASNVSSKEQSGSGLGLYLVHSLTKLLGGTVECRSKENEGSTFTVTLPRSPLYDVTQ